ncbi:UDP-glycosyltransferase 83A1 [Striga hermonthica]|uniref:Glycosyltransferase n=1 Tax=Striga hermonthica TaxID=68872 RepID=A0A9N7NEV1_STRHE|nr:UDP-glycosyltransferase 83A1 [Striga hermonthica]
MAKPHVLVVTYPAQGHVIPLLEFSQWLVTHGLRVTLVNTEFIQKKLAGSNGGVPHGGDLAMVSIPDGLEPWDDRKDLRRNTEAFYGRVPAAELESVIARMNEEEEGRIACVVADVSMAWALDVAARMGIRRAVFCTASAAMTALFFDTARMVADGVIDGDGEILKHQLIQLSPDMAAVHTTDFIWACIGDKPTRKAFFHSWAVSLPWIQSADKIICNSAHELEPGAFSLHPELLPMGPLLASNRLAGKTAGSFLPEDSSCLSWLDRHPASSVVYVAHGTSTEHGPAQLVELALGLELTARPFLWVVRDDNEKKLPEGFLERVGDRGMIIRWAPQQEVLRHPSVGCFVSHCGWNSTVEGVSSGVPIVCWPYFADQRLNRSYICDKWRVGLGVRQDESSGVVRREEIKEKVERVLGDEGFKERALDVKAKVVGSVTSRKNMNRFVEWIKDGT